MEGLPDDIERSVAAEQNAGFCWSFRRTRGPEESTKEGH